MTPQELKESLLWNAIQGKLTTQNSSESVDKSVDAFSTKHTEDYYFDIPSTWVWVRIGDVFDLVNGKAFKPSDWSDVGDPIVRIQNLNDKNAPYNYCNTPCEEKYYLHGGELLFSWSGTPGTSFGAFIWHGGKAVLNQHIFIVYPRMKASSEYLMYALNAELKIFIEKAHGGAGLKHITKKDFDSCYLPIPPLAEQKRIVAKIEELLPYIDRYEKAWNRLEDFNKRFPADMQKSILQLAIQGKLTEQRPEEGTGEALYQQIQKEKQALIKAGKIKKEKPLPEITENEIPFDIPDSWKWIRLGDICSIVTGRLDANAQNKNGKYAFFTCGVEVYKTCDYAFDCDAILLGGNNASGDYKMHRYCGKFNAYQRVYVISGQNRYILDYLYHVIEFWLPLLKKNSQGTTTRFIKLGQVTNMLVPFSPLAEQKRIVAMLEELLPLCERLK